MNRPSLIGHIRLIDDIRRWIINLADSQMINLIGPRGSGKSKIIDHIVEQIRSNAPEWTAGHDFKIVRFSGASFPKDSSIITFICEQLIEQLPLSVDMSEIAGIEISVVKTAIRQLLNDRGGAPILIIIDEASRAIEYADVQESQSLIALRMPLVVGHSKDMR